MLSQEIERKFTFYFCLPTDVFLVEDALSAYRWVRYQRAGLSQQTCLNSLIHPSLRRILHLNDISCRYTLTLRGSGHRKHRLLGPCVQLHIPSCCFRHWFFPLSGHNCLPLPPPLLPLVSSRSLSFLLQFPGDSKGSASLLRCPWPYRGIGNASTCQQLAPDALVPPSQNEP